MLDEARYGKLILETPWGRYYWCEALCDVSYFAWPKGLRATRPTNSYALQWKKNTLEHAVRWAAEMAIKDAKSRANESVYAAAMKEH